MTRFSLALIALSAAALAGWQGALYVSPAEYQFAGWILFGLVSLGSMAMAVKG